MQADQSIARTHDGNGPFKILSPTFDSSNGNHPSGLVINEWMPFNESEEALCHLSDSNEEDQSGIVPRCGWHY